MLSWNYVSSFQRETFTCMKCINIIDLTNNKFKLKKKLQKKDRKLLTTYNNNSKYTKHIFNLFKEYIYFKKRELQMIEIDIEKPLKM